MTRFFTLYKEAFGGLSRPTWMLSLIMLINRSGTMVLPFLTIYLTSALGFSLEQTGITMAAFGLGSLCGSYLGGWLTDKIGHFPVQVGALVGGGILFILLSQVQTFEILTVGIFILSTVADSLRPANATSVAFYAKPENITRAFSLNRMSMNLGFSFGPAIGGFLASKSYELLFIVDGVTCITAGIFFYFYFRNQKGNEDAIQHEQPNTNDGKSPWKDIPYLWFALICMIFAIVFFQLFSALPLYYKDVFALDENRIGTLLGLNGLIVFLLEMIIVHLLVDRVPLWKLIAIGTVLNGLSFIVLNLYLDIPSLYLAMIVLSIAEIFAMPFMATVVTRRSGAKNRGRYMSVYTIAYAGANILAPIMGTWVIAHYSFGMLWWICGLLALISTVGIVSMRKTFLA